MEGVDHHDLLVGKYKIDVWQKAVLGCIYT